MDFKRVVGIGEVDFVSFIEFFGRFHLEDQIKIR
jgi:hypothetical protein